MKPDPRNVLAYIEAIEAEMRRAGFWQESPLEPQQSGFRRAFASDTMTFAQWLQFVFIPAVREAARTGQFPSESSVAAQAVREFDGVDEAADLLRLLSEFDTLFS